MADGHDPMFDPDTDGLDVHLKHVVRSCKLVDVGSGVQPVELFRVFIDLGVRWVRPVAGDGEEDADRFGGGE